jgi:hypothetical protein
MGSPNTGLESTALDFIINESWTGGNDMGAINTQIEDIAAVLKSVHISTASTNIDARLQTWRADWQGIQRMLFDLNDRVTHVKQALLSGDAQTTDASRG